MGDLRLTTSIPSYGGLTLNIGYCLETPDCRLATAPVTIRFGAKVKQQAGYV